MPTELDITIVPKVLELVNKFGQLASFQVTTSPTYDPAQGSVDEATTPVERKVTPPTLMKQPMGGNMSTVGATKVFLPAAELTFEPITGMRVILGGLPYVILMVDSIYSGEQIALYGIALKG